jgi:antitoxin StbD
MILDRADQAITVTDVQRRTKVLFDKLQSGEQDRYVVMRDGKPIFIMIRPFSS